MLRDIKLTAVSETDSSLRNLKSTTWLLAPATHSFLLSGHKDINCIANGSSSTPSTLLDLGFSNTLAVFNLYRTCRVPADASQNFILPSACLKNGNERKCSKYGCVLNSLFKILKFLNCWTCYIPAYHGFYLLSVHRITMSIILTTHIPLYITKK